MRLALILIAVLVSSPSLAADPVNTLLNEYRSVAGANTTFDARAGRAFWYADHDGRACAGCHGTTPRDTGEHARTGKTIAPMAPSVNPERLTNERTIRKWFLRNCKWTLGRECTAVEKGNLLTWLEQQ